jgi:hypothetical protein
MVINLFLLLPLALPLLLPLTLLVLSSLLLLAWFRRLFRQDAGTGIAHVHI